MFDHETLHHQTCVVPGVEVVVDAIIIQHCLLALVDGVRLDPGEVGVGATVGPRVGHPWLRRYADVLSQKMLYIKRHSLIMHGDNGFVADLVLHTQMFQWDILVDVHMVDRRLVVVILRRHEGTSVPSGRVQFRRSVVLRLLEHYCGGLDVARESLVVLT